VKTYRALQRLWQPPAETLGNLAGIVRAHWQAARVPEQLFWVTPVSWLEHAAASSRQARPADYQLTSGGRLIK
jgi:hypothetical protein